MYETLKSHTEGKGILGIRIHNMKDQYGRIDKMGCNPLDVLQEEKGNSGPLSQLYETYDWVLNNGRKNIGDWIEQAAINAGRASKDSFLNY